MVDHSSHHAGHSMDNDMDGAESGMMMTMTMYFYQSTKVHFLFESYDVTSASGYFSVLLVAFIFGFLTETLSIVQDRFDQQITQKVREGQSKKRGRRCAQGIVFILRLWFSYLCMLAVMTYNMGVIWCVVFGLATSYMILGFNPAEVIVVQNTLSQCDKNQPAR